jgi:hypothetical protein
MASLFIVFIVLVDYAALAAFIIPSSTVNGFHPDSLCQGNSKYYFNLGYCFVYPQDSKFFLQIY